MKVPGILLSLMLLAPFAAAAQEVQPVSIPLGTTDLLWQGETYTPPFYLGRPLWGGQSRVTIVAIPHVRSQSGGEVSPSSLIYKWDRNGERLDGASGLGQRSIAFNDTVLSKSAEIKVTVYLSDGQTLAASGSINLNPIAPKLVVVEENPLLGLLLNNAVVGTYTLAGKEVTFAALPLFAPVASRLTPTEVYTWRTEAGDVRAGSSVTYRVPDGTNGTSQVTVKAENKNTLMQASDKTFLVQFGKDLGF